VSRAQSPTSLLSPFCSSVHGAPYWLLDLVSSPGGVYSSSRPSSMYFWVWVGVVSAAVAVHAQTLGYSHGAARSRGGLGWRQR
jgi:hypothetical protein